MARPYWRLFLSQLNDGLIIFLVAFAVLQFVVCILTGQFRYLLDSLNVLCAVAFLATITSVCEYTKDKQFIIFQSMIIEEYATVFRGIYPESQEVHTSNIVVGDLLLLQAGDRVPADCILVQGMDLRVD